MRLLNIIRALFERPRTDPVMDAQARRGLALDRLQDAQDRRDSRDIHAARRALVDATHDELVAAVWP